MRKKELIKALSKIEEGIADVKNLLIADEQVETAHSTSAKKDTVEEVSTQSNEDDTEVQSNGAYTREDLLAMKYNDLKKLGKEIGIKCTGTRDEIIDKILSVPMTDSPMAEPVEDEEEEKSNVVPMKKKSVKKEEPVEDTDEEDDIEEQYLAMAREALADNDLEDIVEVLAEAGIKLSKLQAKKEDIVMTKLAEAFQNGMIEAEGDDDEDTDTDNEENTEGDELEFSEDSYFDEYDPEGINDPETMSKKRAKAIKSLVSDIINKYEEEELTTDDIESELEDIVTDEDIELLGEDYSEEELVAFYIEMKKRFVDNDGNICEPSDPYEIGEDNFCCGHQLQYDKKGKKYVCPICEEEYEAE